MDGHEEEMDDARLETVSTPNDSSKGGMVQYNITLQYIPREGRY
jgi:hypothetical protein